LVGIFSGGKFTWASLALVLAAMMAFLIRQPVTMAVKAWSGRRSKTDLPAARFWTILYGVILLGALAYLVMRGFSYLLLLAIPGVPVFAWHLWLVGRRAERRQAGVEILATGVLSLVAPAAFWVGSGSFHPDGWWLWALTWMQSAASIVYAYLRLEQRGWKTIPARPQRFRAGARSLNYAAFNFLATALLGLVFRLLPAWIFLPYLLQLIEVIWGIDHPAVGWKPTRIGIRQLIVSTLWTVLFIIFWRR
jgi:hypothetical protein